MLIFKWFLLLPLPLLMAPKRNTLFEITPHWHIKPPPCYRLNENKFSPLQTRGIACNHFVTIHDGIHEMISVIRYAFKRLAFKASIEYAAGVSVSGVIWHYAKRNACNDFWPSSILIFIHSGRIIQWNSGTGWHSKWLVAANIYPRRIYFIESQPRKQRFEHK